MLDGGGNLLRLQAVDVLGSNVSVQVRILGEGFEATSAEGRALGVTGRTEENVAAWSLLVGVQGP